MTQDQGWACAREADQKQQLGNSRKRLFGDVRALCTLQERNRHTLLSEWRQGSGDRREAWSKINATRDLRRQVTERFAAQSRNRGGRDRGH
jgi:hypothetical protein